MFVHVERVDLPMALAELHRVLTVDAPVEIVMFGGDRDLAAIEDDSMGPRRFALWAPEHLRDVAEGAGFVVERFDVIESDGWPNLELGLRRALTLPDTVGPDEVHGLLRGHSDLLPQFHGTDSTA